MNNTSLLDYGKQILRNKTVRILLAAFCLLVALAWVADNAYISISVEGNPKDISVTIAKAGTITEKSVAKTYSGATAKKLVSQGTYEIYVTAGGKSYYGIATSGRFFSTTKVLAQLSPENERSFVGNNPLDCAEHAGGVLLTFNCDRASSEAKIHIPATAKLPTYTTTKLLDEEGSPIGDTSGYATTKEGVLGLRITEDEEDAFGFYSIFKIKDSPDYVSSVQTVFDPVLLEDTHAPKDILLGLDSQQNYRIMAYNGGFAVYSTNLQKLYAYKNTQTINERTEISLPASKTAGVKPVKMTGYNTAIGAVYATETKPFVFNIIHVKDTKATNVNITGDYTNVGLCGEFLVCASNGKITDIYSVKGNKASLLYSLSASSFLVTNGGNLQLLTPKGVVTFNTSDNMGYLSYQKDSLTIHTINPSVNGYIATISGNKLKKSALYIETNLPTTNTIDKQAAKLSETLGISSVSVYGSFIFVTPTLGELIYNNETNSFANNPAEVSRSVGVINTAVQALGINTTTYTVINLAL